jgi:hypothetical protein
MACATLKRHLDSDPLYSPNPRPAKRRRLARGFIGIPGGSPVGLGRIDTPSPFSTAAKLTPEQMQAQLKHEIRTLRKWRQLQFGLDNDGGTRTIANPLVSTSNSNVISPSSSVVVSSPAAGLENFGEFMKSGLGVSKDTPLFTFKQVGLICERFIQQREEAIRQEYDQVLASKLSEQYDTFVKFTHDQIQKQFEKTAAPSYLS